MNKITSRKYNMYKFNIHTKLFFFCYRANKEEKEEKR